MRHSSPRFAWLVLVGLAALSGCATVSNPTDPRDPLEPVNRAIYHFNDVADHLVLRPAAQVYHDVLPPIVRTGVGNFFSNINDVLVALNNLLQGKVEKAASDAGRVVVNTTIGLLGLFDVATKMGLEKHDEDFGQTLGYWGLGPGPYLVLPLFGPSDFRDAVGRVGDFYSDPITYVNPPHDRNILWGTRVIHRRAELLGTEKVLETMLDPYAFMRDGYLQRRRYLIYDGNPPPEPEDEGNGPGPGTNGAKPDGGQPRSENRQVSPVSRFDAPPIAGSVLVSGEPLTPAEQAALEDAQRAPRRAAPETQARASALATPAGPTR